MKQICKLLLVTLLTFLVLSNYSSFLSAGLIQVKEGALQAGIPFGGRYEEEKEKVLVFSIKSDKNEYKFEEAINIEVTFENISPGIKRIALYDEPRSDWLVFSYYKVIIEDSRGEERIFDLEELFKSTELPLVGKFLKPNQGVSFIIPLTEKLRQLYPDFELLPATYHILVEYNPKEIYNHIGYWTGSLKSNILKIKIGEK